jgi:hypothetical protein
MCWIKYGKRICGKLPCSAFGFCVERIRYSLFCVENRLQDAHVNSYDEFNNSAASSRERELIQSLEEVVEIHGDFSDVKPSHKHFIEQKALSKGRLVSNEKNLMSAILNERSCDDSDATHSEVGVACFGRRPPLSNQSNFRSSKNGFVSVKDI